ncbi:MAG: DUF6314 family protein [Shimia sp.]
MKHEAFLGFHHVERDIVEADGTVQHAVGAAGLHLRDGGAPFLYAESLKLTLATGQVFRASRRYIWHPTEGGFDIHFDNDRFFHAMRWATPQAVHWCDPDRYDVTYDWQGWPDWSSTWSVKGPRKDYILRSRYRHQPLAR